jgi:hypothetical protein
LAGKGKALKEEGTRENFTKPRRSEKAMEANFLYFLPV